MQRNTEAGINILGKDDGTKVSVKGARWSIDSYSIAMSKAGTGRLLQVINGPDDLTISHLKETITDYAYTFLVFSGTPLTRFAFHDVEVYQGDYGIAGDGTALGLPTVTWANPNGYMWSNVTVHHAGFHAGEERSIPYPAGTIIVP